jgi:signal transduction histidine kinase
MMWLRDLLAASGCGLALLHGLAFFALGYSIVFLARRSARLEVARGLLLLAAFGFCEALVAWVPVWFAFSSGSPLPNSLRLLLLGAGYAFLLAFALQTQAPSERRQLKRWAPAGGVLALWLTGLAIARLAGASLEQVCLGGEIAARYGMALPGGLMAAWGLRRQAYHTIGRDRLSLVRPPVRVARVALGAFGVFGGLIGPAAPFFPASWFNQELLLHTTSIPVALFRGLCGVVITYGIVRALRIYLSEIDLWVEGVERVQALASERERIGRELHDGIIQSIFAAGLMLEAAQQSIPEDPGIADTQLQHAIDSLNQTIQDIRRYIFDLRGEMPEDDLETGLSKMLKDFRANTLLETELTVDGEDPQALGPERRRHVFQIAREALANAARHAQARRMTVHLKHDTSEMELRISDDGVGASGLPMDKGQGLRNMRERARLLEGMLDIDSAPDKGVTLVLTVPY